MFQIFKYSSDTVYARPLGTTYEASQVKRIHDNEKRDDKLI